MKSLSKKILLYTLYGLIILMVIFSLGTIKNQGQKGYDKCIQDKCELKNEAYCNKFREKNNCCLGAGGKMAVSGNNQICVFD